MFYSDSVSPPSEPAKKKYIVLRRRQPEKEMGDDEGSLRKSCRVYTIYIIFMFIICMRYIYTWRADSFCVKNSW